MRAVLRRAAIWVTASAGAGVLAAGMVAGAGPAAAAGQVLFAAPAAVGTGDCSTVANACDLGTALADVTAGGTVELVTPGTTAHYFGNWSVSTPGTSASAPVTIEPAPGVSNPALDGNNGNASGCSTTACNGSVLTVGAGEFVALSAITITNGVNSSTGEAGGLANAGTVTITGCAFTGNHAGIGGAINNGGGGTVTVTDSTFSGNGGVKGGAIDSGDSGAGTVTVTGSTFTGNGGIWGGAIDSGDNGGGGTVTVTASTFTGNGAKNAGGAIDSGGDGGGGSVTVTASTFSGNTVTFDGGAIDSGDEGGGSVTVTASTFTGNTAGGGGYLGDGGAIDSGDEGGSGSVTVTASTFSGNTVTRDGGAIDSGDQGGGGSAQVTASTFTGNTASVNGNTIDGGDGGGAGTVAVAGDVFDGSASAPAPTCVQAGGTWTDGGYNAGTDSSCYGAGPPSTDLTPPPSSLDLNPLANNGGPTFTVEPMPGSPVIGLIKSPPVTVTLGGSPVQLCPATDQRGFATTAGTNCDAGAVQTTGKPTLALKDSAAPATFNAAGQVITYSYEVSNTGAGPLSGISVTDPAVPAVSCPAPVLAAGTSETCTGSYTATSADLTAGKITDTATASGATSNGVPVASAPATVTVAKGWPPVVSGTFRPAAGAAQGFYLGVVNNAWQLLVTHPGTTKVGFTGRISVPAGTLGHITLINPTAGHQVSTTGKVITFSLPNYGKVTGFRFTTTATVASITVTLSIGGHPATAAQINLGNPPTHPGSGSPLTFTR